MGIGSRNGGDRLRTVWTPEMDRYFIELMAEQVKKGNKFDDHLFSKRAWKNMAGSFNARFKFQYEKDVLKNRHKTLRNLYKSVRNLVDQRGFSWDDTRQMVIAENHVWDDYIKAHPDARSFRIKTIPYFNDLCLIYKDVATEKKGDIALEESMLSCGNRTTEGEALALNVHDIIIDEDYGISMVENEGDIDVSQQVLMQNASGVVLAGRTRTYWQPPMDRYFVDLMLDQVQRGGRIDGVFRRQAWVEMIVLFNAKFGFSYDSDVLKNRYKTLKRQHNLIKNLLELDGFVWDESRQMVTAKDCVWQDYIKAHSDARQFMTRPIPYFKDLCTVCDPTSDEKEGSCDQDSEEDISNEPQKNKRPLERMSPCLSHSKRSRNDDEGMASAIREMATAVSSLSDKKANDENSVSIESVIEAVQALPDMDDDLVLDACDLLEDEKKAKTFMTLDVKLRKKWLLRKLRPETLI